MTKPHDSSVVDAGALLRTEDALSVRIVQPHRKSSRTDHGWLAQLLLRLHFSAGILVGPFILIAAVSGAIYSLTPSIEQLVYQNELRAPVAASSLSLAEQVRAAQRYAGADAALSAVRPASEPGATTRVLFSDPQLASSESRAVFVDPGTGQIRGDLISYGTSGALPLRTWVDNLHRNLNLGDAGRFYSELAASWLGIVALAGLGLWINRVRKSRTKRDFVRPNRKYRGYRRTLSWHTSLGIWVILGALFLSTTGITWSKYAGSNVSGLRTAFGWGTPTVSAALDSADAAGSEHAHHLQSATAAAADGVDINRIDQVFAVAQQTNVNTDQVEILPSSDPQRAWIVQEIQRSYPTEVDSVAINGTTLEVVDRADFSEFPLAAKLTRWGIDLHMGTMFGLANQIALFLLASGIAALVVLGYRMWWQRRPTRSASFEFASAPRRGVIHRAPWWGVAAVLIAAVGIGWVLPFVGWTLVGFVLIDTVIGIVHSWRLKA